MSKRHNLRQRKKLHIGEYRELGFTITVATREDLPDEAMDELIDAFFEAVEARGLMFGGVFSDGFVCKDGRGSATDDDRLAVREWFLQRPEFESVVVSELVDAWW